MVLAVLDAVLAMADAVLAVVVLVVLAVPDAVLAVPDAVLAVEAVVVPAVVAGGVRVVAINTNSRKDRTSILLGVTRGHQGSGKDSPATTATE